MKSIIAVLLLVTAVIAHKYARYVPKTMDEVKAIRQDCLKKNPLTAADLASMNNLVYLESKSMDSYLTCFFKSENLWSAHRGIRIDRVEKQFGLKFTKAQLRSVIKECFQNRKLVSGTTTAYKQYMCILKNSEVGPQVKAAIKKAFYTQ